MPSPLDRNYHLLLADADPAIASAVTSALGEHGHHVTVSHDGNEALRRVRADTFDLTVVDVGLPGMDGFQFLTACQRDDKLSVMPVIVLSAAEGDDDCERAFALGAAGYVAKPLKLPLLSHTVWQLIRNRARDQEMRWLKARLGIETDREQDLALTG